MLYWVLWWYLVFRWSLSNVNAVDFYKIGGDPGSWLGIWWWHFCLGQTYIRRGGGFTPLLASLGGANHLTPIFVRSVEKLPGQGILWECTDLATRKKLIEPFRHLHIRWGTGKVLGKPGLWRSPKRLNLGNGKSDKRIKHPAKRRVWGVGWSRLASIGGGGSSRRV